MSPRCTGYAQTNRQASTVSDALGRCSMHSGRCVRRHCREYGINVDYKYVSPFLYVHTCASVCVCGFGRTGLGAPVSAWNVRAFSAGVDRVWFGSQAFSQASAFNQNLAVWNTASVTTMCWVCAAFSGGAPRVGRARPVDRCGAACCARRHRRCAVCANLQVIACADFRL